MACHREQELGQRRVVENEDLRRSCFDGADGDDPFPFRVQLALSYIDGSGTRF